MFSSSIIYCSKCLLYLYNLKNIHNPIRIDRLSIYIYRFSVDSETFINRKTFVTNLLLLYTSFMDLKVYQALNHTNIIFAAPTKNQPNRENWILNTCDVNKGDYSRPSKCCNIFVICQNYLRSVNNIAHSV